MLHADYGPDVAACRVRAVMAAAHELDVRRRRAVSAGQPVRCSRQLSFVRFSTSSISALRSAAAARQVLRAVYGDIETDTVCFALHFAHLRIVR